MSSEINDLIKALSINIEHELFYGIASPKEKLCALLYRLGIKEARPRGIQFESLEATLNQITFQSQMLGQWPTKKST